MTTAGAGAGVNPGGGVAADSCAFDFVDWNHVFARAAADYFGADIVQHVWVVMNGLRALIGGRAGVGKALSERRHLLGAACQTRCHEGDDDCCAAIGEAWHGGRCPLANDFAGAEKSAAKYSGRGRIDQAGSVRKIRANTCREGLPDLAARF